MKIITIEGYMTISKRDIQIVHLLQNHKYLTSNEMAHYLKVSEKTIRNNITVINASSYDFGFKIETKRNRGYQLVILDEYKFNNYLNININIPDGQEERIKALLLILVNHEKLTSLDSLCNKWYISEKTLKNDFKTIRDIVEKNNLRVEKNKEKGIQLIGDEIYIRNICNEYDLFHSNTKFDKKIIKKILYESEIKNGFMLSDFMIDVITKHIFLAMIRIDQGKFICSDIVKDISSTKEFKIANLLLNDITSFFGIIFPLHEREYIAFHIMGKQFIRDNGNNVLSSETELLINEILVLLNTTFEINIKHNFEFRISLGLHLEQLIKRLNYGTQMKNPLLDDIKLKYSFAYTMAQAVCILINRKTNKTVNEDEIGYIALSLQLLLENDKTQHQKKYILLVCSLGQTSANLMKYKYLETFKDEIESIEVSSAKEAENMDLNRFDYIFTMIPLNIKTSIPILNAQFFFDETYINQIKKDLHDKDTGLYYFENIDFIPILYATDKEDAIKQLCDIAVKKNNVTLDLYHSVMERESLASTDYTYRTAIPHPNNLVVDSTYVCMAILDKPILWENQSVDIVTLVLVGRKDKDTIQQFYQLFAHFLMDEVKVDRFITQRNKQSLMDYIRIVNDEREKEWKI